MLTVPKRPSDRCRRTIVATAGVVLAVASSCFRVQEVRLRSLPDLVDSGVDQGLSDIGHAPAMNHPAGLSVNLECTFVEEHTREDLPRRDFLVTIDIQNRTASPLELPWKDFVLRIDNGQQIRPISMVLWNEKEEDYGPAPDVLPPGPRQVVVLRFPAGQRLRLELTIQVCLHWIYMLGGKTHRIATRFRT